MPKRFWLIKSEPSEYAITDLKRDGADWWTGVRNYQARNFLREMRVGDGVLFYHSSCPTPGVAGIAEVKTEAQPDPTQFDPASDYHDGRATPERPLWFCPEIAFNREVELIPLSQLRTTPGLNQMLILRPGNRLSVTPLTESEWRIIIKISAGRGLHPRPERSTPA